MSRGQFSYLTNVILGLCLFTLGLAQKSRDYIILGLIVFASGYIGGMMISTREK
jgi:hydrogenase-4 membrane subunit HyfE